MIKMIYFTLEWLNTIDTTAVFGLLFCTEDKAVKLLFYTVSRKKQYKWQAGEGNTNKTNMKHCADLEMINH